MILPRLDGLLELEVKHFRVINSISPLQGPQTHGLVYHVKLVLSDVRVLVLFNEKLSATLEFLLRHGHLPLLALALLVLVDLLLSAKQSVVILVDDIVPVAYLC